MFLGPLRFNRPSYKLVFDSRYLSKKLVRKAQELDAFLRNYPIDIMTIPGVDETVEAQIERRLTEAHTGSLNFPSIEQIADELGIGKITLYRRLQREGTSYQRIKDNVRREISIYLLCSERLTVDRISEVVGFAEARSFTRAFRAWTGLSPRQYRNLHKESS